MNRLRKVEAHTASWIEIIKSITQPFWKLSRLIRPRGLKWTLCSCCTCISLSRLIQPRGLKSVIVGVIALTAGLRLIQPRGLKFPQAINIFLPGEVEAYTVSWIEIDYLSEPVWESEYDGNRKRITGIYVYLPPAAWDECDYRRCACREYSEYQTIADGWKSTLQRVG